MEKVSVTVQIPALHSSYEFIVPNTMEVEDVQKLMLKILGSEYGISQDSSDVRLFQVKDGKVLCLKNSFAQLGISDGDKLVLM